MESNFLTTNALRCANQYAVVTINASQCANQYIVEQKERPIVCLIKGFGG